MARVLIFGAGISGTPLPCICGGCSAGDRSYLATDGQATLAVDPQRDTDRVLAAAARAA
jgi:hypothetical protein